MSADKTDSLDAHVDAAAPPGTMAYYALLFTPDEARRPVGALMALAHEFEQLAGRNPETAAFRLNWWAEELERLALARPSHPVTTELLRSGQNDRTALDRLSERFRAASADLAGTGHATWDELNEHLRLRHASIQALQARALGSQPDTLRAYTEHLGIALGLGHLLASAPRDAAAGRMRLPAELLDAHDVTAADLAGTSTDGAAARLAADVRDRIRATLDRALEALPPGERATQRTGLVQAALQRRIAERLVIAPPDRWLATAHVGGLASLWLAWRTARRAARGRL